MQSIPFGENTNPVHEDFGHLKLHGIDLFIQQLDKELVEQIAKRRQEAHYYTFQTIFEAVLDHFPDNVNQIMGGLVEMLAFDAIVGNNDRHPANWGIIAPVSGSRQPRFSPVYDTARGLFWNNDETRIEEMLRNEESLIRYVSRSQPQIGYDGKQKMNHFDLIGAIAADHAEFRSHLEEFTDPDRLRQCLEMIPKEFEGVLSEKRLELIARCLSIRHDRYCRAVQERTE